MFGLHLVVERRNAAGARRGAGVRAVSLVAATLVAFAPAATVLATDTGQVPVTVTGSAAACITLDSQPSYDFGTLHLSTPTVTVSGTAPSSAIVSDCSGLDQTLEAAFGGLASNNGDKAFWTPIDPAHSSATNPCIVGPDRVIFKIGNTAQTQITATLAPVDTLAANTTTFKEWGSLTMPCTGSSGASDAMSGDVEIVATIP